MSNKKKTTQNKTPVKKETVKVEAKKKLTKTILIIAAFVLAVALAIGGTLFFVNGGFGTKDDSKSHMLSFAQAASLTDMEKLDGEQVSIIGYMSTLSPVSGKFMYLMNLPYQSCPFCIPNTTTLSNTLAIYAKNGKTFEFTDRAIQVTGTLEFGDWTDEFGYQYSYRIKDATFVELDTENMSEELKLWQSIAASNVVGDIYSMFDYLSFVCYWAEYTATFGGEPDYCYPNDMIQSIAPGGYYEYGYKESYYTDIIKTIESVDPDKFEELEAIVNAAQALSQKAVMETTAGNYTVTTEYSNAFGDGRQQYKLNNIDELDAEFQALYTKFATWISSWEV
jgi:hypothetical protein